MTPQAHLETFSEDSLAGDAFMLFVERACGCDYPGLEFYWDRDRQMALGEGNKLECKFNRGLWKWQSMFVETAQRYFREPDWGPWIPSGLMRDDQTTHMAMGDYRLFFVIPKEPLMAMIPEDEPDFCRVTSDKSKAGFRLYFPGAFANAEHIYLFGALADHYRGAFPDGRRKLWACNCKEAVFEVPGACPACGKEQQKIEV